MFYNRPPYSISLTKPPTQVFSTCYRRRPYNQYIKFSEQPWQLSPSLWCVLAKAADVASIAILLTAYTYDLQINIYARNQKLLYRSKYRQEARNGPQIKLITFTKQGRKGLILKAISVPNIGFIYTYIVTLRSQAYLKPPLLTTPTCLYIFSLQHTLKLLNSLPINS